MQSKFSFVETLVYNLLLIVKLLIRIVINANQCTSFAVINLSGVSTKLNLYIVVAAFKTAKNLITM